MVDRFSATQSGMVVHVNWSITEGNLCNGLGIQRSVNGLHFNTIGFIDGVCGSLTEAVRYTFTDSMPPIGTTVYYRIDLGPYGFSDLTTLFVVDAGSRPFHLFVSDGFLRIRPLDSTAEYSVEITDSEGRIARQLKGRGWTDFPLPARQNIVYYRLELKGVTYTGAVWAN